MPRTTIRVLRVNSVQRTGPRGLFQSHCVTGAASSTEIGLLGTGVDDFGTFQAQTTSDLVAALCERVQQSQRPITVLWKDGRYGKEIVEVDLI